MMTPILKLVKLNIKPRATLEFMSESCYGAKPFYNPQEDPEPQSIPNPELNSSQETVTYYDSDRTDCYWPIKQDNMDRVDTNVISPIKCKVPKCKVLKRNTPRHHIIHARPSQLGFRVSVHSTHRCK